MSADRDPDHPTFVWECDFAGRLVPALYHGLIPSSDAARIVVRHPLFTDKIPSLAECVQRWPAPVSSEHP